MQFCGLHFVAVGGMTAHTVILSGVLQANHLHEHDDAVTLVYLTIYPQSDTRIMAQGACKGEVPQLDLTGV